MPLNTPYTVAPSSAGTIRPVASKLPDIVPTFMSPVDITGSSVDTNLDAPAATKEWPNFFINSNVDASAYPISTPYENIRKYPTYDPNRDNEDYYARNQGFWNSVGSGLGRLVLTTGTKLGTGIGYLAGFAGIGNDSEKYGTGFSSWIAGAADNSIAKWFNNIEDTTIKQDWLPIYQKASEKDHGFFRHMGDLDFWTSDLTDGAAFMLSSFVPGLAVSKIGLGVKVARGLAALKGLTAIDETAALSAEGLTGTSEAVNTAANTTKGMENGFQQLPKVVSWIDNAKLARNTDVAATSIINTASAAMFSSKQVQDTVYNSLVSKRDPFTNKNVYSPDQARQIAAKSARDTYLMNLGALSLSSLWEANLIFKKTPLPGSAFINDVTTAGLMDDAALIKRTLGQRALSFVKPAAEGFAVGGIWTGNTQLAIQRLNQSNENFDLDFSGKLKQVGKNFLSQSLDALSGNDIEAAQSIGIGGLIGAGASALFHTNEQKELKNKVANLNNQVSIFKQLGNIYKTNEEGSLQLDANNNPSVDIDKIKSFVASANKILNMQSIADNLESRGAQSLANIYKDEVTARFAKAHFDAGLGDLLFQKLNDIKNIHKEDLISLGFSGDSDPVVTSTNIDALKTKVKALSDLYDNIQNNYLPIKKDIGNKKFYDITDKLYYLSARSKSLIDEKARTQQEYESVQNNADNYDASFNSESDHVHDEYNQLYEDVQAAKRNKGRVEDERDYFNYLSQNPTSEIEQNGIYVKTPNKIDQAEKNGVTVVTPQISETDANDLINEKQKILDQFVEDNKDVLNRLTKDSIGRYLYENKDKNILPSSKKMANLEVAQSELNLSNHATLNVMSRLADLKYGPKYYDDVYSKALQSQAEEARVFDSVPDQVETPISNIPKAPNPSRVPQDEIDAAFNESEIDKSISDKKNIVNHLADKLSNGEELTDKENDLYNKLKNAVDEKVKKNSEDLGGLFDKINELEREKEALENKQDATVEDEVRKSEIDKQLDNLREQADDEFAENDIERTVDDSTNIKVEDKEKYKDVLKQVAQNKKRVVATQNGWTIDGVPYRKVTSLIGDDIPNEVRAKVQNAINAGYTIDDIVKAYFANQIDDNFRSQISTKISGPALDGVIKQLDSIKKKLTDKGIEIVASNVMAWDEESKIAGEIDILGVDKRGNFKIYEVQARRPDIYRIYGKLGKGLKIREIDSRRLSAYRNLFANQYGSVPDEISIMFPFNVTYDKNNSSGFIEEAKAKQPIRFTPNNLVEIKRKMLSPVRAGSKFDNLDMLHIYGDSFLTDDTAKSKFRTLLRTVSFAKLKDNLVLSVRKAEQDFQDRYKLQSDRLSGIDNKYKLTKYKGFDNLYSLAGNMEMALKYENTLIGYLSPAQTLAYKDAEGKYHVVDENTDQETYSTVTGNSKETFQNFKYIASAYKQMYNDIVNRLDNSGEDHIDLEGDDLKNLMDARISYGEYDKIGSGKDRPDLKDLSLPGVKVGTKLVPTVVNVDENGGIRVVMDKSARKGKSSYKKIQEIDRWVNNNLDNVTKTMTNNDGQRVTDYAAIIETPNKEYKVIPLRKKGEVDINLADDFVPDLGSKFTTAVSKDVFKNENLMIVPKYNEETINVNLKDTNPAATIYPTEDVAELEKSGVAAGEVHQDTHLQLAKDFVSSLTDEQKSKLGQELGQSDQVENKLIENYQNSEWSSMEDYLANIKECKL